MYPKKIIIHHSATPDRTLRDFTAIKEYHIKVRKFSDIGYHYVIERVGLRKETGDLYDNYVINYGRKPNIVGAHALYHNADSIGICVIGNFNIDEVAYAQELTLIELCTSLCAVFRINADNIFGHGELLRTNTECPGKHLKEIIPNVREYVHDSNINSYLIV